MRSPSSQPTNVVTRRLVRDVEFCRDVSQRVDAAVQLAQGLPRTAVDIDILLSATPHKLSKEVQYSVLNFLDFSDIAPSHVRRLLPSVFRVLRNVDSPAAYLWLKTGCLLGDGFFQAADRDTRKRILAELATTVRTGRSVYSRNAAFHGIEHALNTATLTEGKKLLSVMREVAMRYRALSLRRSAYKLLHDGWWWGNKGQPSLHTLAKKIGKTLRYPR